MLRTIAIHCNIFRKHGMQPNIPHEDWTMGSKATHGVFNNELRWEPGGELEAQHSRIGQWGAKRGTCEGLCPAIPTLASLSGSTKCTHLLPCLSCSYSQSLLEGNCLPIRSIFWTNFFFPCSQYVCSLWRLGYKCPPLGFKGPNPCLSSNMYVITTKWHVYASVSPSQVKVLETEISSYLLSCLLSLTHSRFYWIELKWISDLHLL